MVVRVAEGIAVGSSPQSPAVGPVPHAIVWVVVLDVESHAISDEVMLAD